MPARVASRTSSGACSQEMSDDARSRTAPSPTSKSSHGRACSGTSAASAPVTSARPECAALTGRAPQAAASAATIPNASGNVMGTTWASQAGSSSASSGCSRRPVSATRSGSRAAAAR